jgi:hypothetical protein
MSDGVGDKIILITSGGTGIVSAAACSKRFGPRLAVPEPAS